MSGQDRNIYQAIGQLQGKMESIDNTQIAILNQLEKLNKWNTELYASTKANGEKIADVEAEIDKMDQTLDTLKSSKSKALGFIAAVTLFSGAIGAGISAMIGKGAT